MSPLPRDEISPNTPLLVILSSPSGAGKTSLAREVMAHDKNIGFSISATTRPAREGEIDGHHYHFMSEAEFRKRVGAGEMLEYAQVFGHLYGTPRGPVEEALAAGRDVLFDVDWQGGEQLRDCALKDHVVSVFVLPPSIKELHERLKSRAQDADNVIETRMRKSRDEISHWKEYDYLIVNRSLTSSRRALEAILQAERLKRENWPDAARFVEGLNREFEELYKEL